MGVHVPEEFELRRRRPDDEDRIDAGECPRDLAEESMRIVRVCSCLPTSFRMPVKMVLRRKNRRFVRRFRMDVKDPRFLVIDPDDGVCRHDLMILRQINNRVNDVFHIGRETTLDWLAWFTEAF